MKKFLIPICMGLLMCMPALAQEWHAGVGLAKSDFVNPQVRANLGYQWPNGIGWEGEVSTVTELLVNSRTDVNVSVTNTETTVGTVKDVTTSTPGDTVVIEDSKKGKGHSNHTETILNGPTSTTTTTSTTVTTNETVTDTLVSVIREQFKLSNYDILSGPTYRLVGSGNVEAGVRGLVGTEFNGKHWGFATKNGGWVTYHIDPNATVRFTGEYIYTPNRFDLEGGVEVLFTWN